MKLKPEKTFTAPVSQRSWVRIPFRSEFFSGLNFTTAQVVCITAMINHVSLHIFLCSSNIFFIDLTCKTLNSPLHPRYFNIVNGRDNSFNIFVFFLSLQFSGMQREASFTSNFARLLEAKAGQLPLKEMVKRAARASVDQHRLSSNLFDPK